MAKSAFGVEHIGLEKSVFSAASSGAVKAGKMADKAKDSGKALNSGWRMGASQRAQGAKYIPGANLDAAVRNPRTAMAGVKASKLATRRNVAIAGGATVGAAGAGAAGGSAVKRRNNG